MNMGKQHQLFPHALIICLRVAFERVDNSADGEHSLLGASAVQTAEKVPAKPEQLSHGREAAPLPSGANAGLPFDQRTSEEPGKSKYPEPRCRFVQAHRFVLG